MTQEKVGRKVEGIFDVEIIPDDYADKRKRTAEGILVSIQEAEFRYKSTAIYADDSKKMLGVRLEIQNRRGKEIVELPKEVPLTDRQAMINQNIRYSQRIWSSVCEGTATDYSLEILSGSLGGRKLTESVFV